MNLDDHRDQVRGDDQVIAELLNHIRQGNEQAMNQIRSDIHDLKKEVTEDIADVKVDVEKVNTTVNNRIDKLDDRLWALIVIMITAVIGVLGGFLIL